MTGKLFQSTLPGWGATITFTHKRGMTHISIHAPRMGSDVFAVPATARILFQSTLPGWGATITNDGTATFRSFQSTLPGWGATINNQRADLAQLFQSTLPGWGATAILPSIVAVSKFQSTLPGWGATQNLMSTINGKAISIHAPRMGSDGSVLQHGFLELAHFNPRSPDGERPVANLTGRMPCLFQSTLPGWGATSPRTAAPADSPISIHAPRMGSDSCLRAGGGVAGISIHAPRMGSDVAVVGQVRDGLISIHAPRMGSD